MSGSFEFQIQIADDRKVVFEYVSYSTIVVLQLELQAVTCVE